MMASIVLEDIGCPLKCEKKDAPVLTGHDLLHDLPGEFAVVRCLTCGLMRTNPRPKPECMGSYYPDDYGPYLDTRVQHAKPTSSSAIRKLFRLLVRRIFNFNTQPLPSLHPGRLLEVGCASGAFLNKMANLGWQVQGIEYSIRAAEAATQLGYSVHAGSLETAPKPTEPFDLIVGWMVLEHLHDPIAGLIKLSECANPGAWLVLSVPNAESSTFRFFKNSWYDLHLPNHLYHFTPRTLGNILDASGWKLERVYHQRVLGSLVASTGYLLRDLGYNKLGQQLVAFPERAGRWNYVFYPIAWLLSLFGQTGRMTIWARIRS